MAVAPTMVGTRAGRPQPQTTAEAGPGDFLDLTRRASRPGYNLAGVPYGQTIDQQLPGAPGYLAYYDLNLLSTGGANATTNTVGANTSSSNAADFGYNNAGITTSARAGVGTSPAAAIQYINVQDAHGTTVFAGNGWEMLYAWPMISGQVGVLAAVDGMKWPSASTSGIATGTATTRTAGFFYHARIPFEVVPGYGLLGIGDASLQPRLHIQTVPLSGLLTTGPSTAPTLTVTVDEAFYGVPQLAPQVRPTGLGTTLQAIQVTCSPNVGTASANRVQVARLGGRLVSLMLVARDSTGQRNDSVWPAFGTNQRIRVIIDGVTILDEMIEERFDKMYEVTGGLFGSANVLNVGLPPAGCIFYTWKDFESQANLGKLDDGKGWIPTNPGTQLEIECTPWGTFSNGPAQITAVLGMLVPGRGDGVSQARSTQL